MNLSDRDKLRMTFTNHVMVDIQATSTLLLMPNPDRIALIIGGPPTNRFTLGLRTAAVLDAGITIYPTNPPLALTLEQLGDAIAGDIFAISAVANQNVSVWEVILRH